jgi:hypothetical protein
MADQIENQRKVVDQSMRDEHALKLQQIAMETANTVEFGILVKNLGFTLDSMIRDLGLIRPAAGNSFVNAAPARQDLVDAAVRGATPGKGPLTDTFANAANAPLNIPDIVKPTQNSNLPPQQVNVVTNGQQTMTVNLPNLEVITNAAITALVYEHVSERFRNLSQEVRTANNFEDVSNALANAATQTQNVEMGNV